MLAVVELELEVEVEVRCRERKLLEKRKKEERRSSHSRVNWGQVVLPDANSLYSQTPGRDGRRRTTQHHPLAHASNPWPTSSHQFLFFTSLCMWMCVLLPPRIHTRTYIRVMCVWASNFICLS